MFTDLFNLLQNYNFDDSVQIEKLDLSKKEDVEKFHDYVKSLKENKLFNSMMKLFTDDVDKFYTNLDDMVDIRHHELTQHDNKVEATPEPTQTAVPKITRPSEKLSTEQGLQIHKLVQEYVDTMIRPYAKGCFDDKTINDAYAGLYEFAAWILTK